LTEVGLVATSRSYIQEELPALMKAGNIPPLELCKKGVKVRIIDQNENILPHGITGEIQIHAPNYLIEGYLDETGELKPLELNEGWLKTGDLGTIDKRGLTVSGRSKDLIFVDGKNVSLAPVEEAAQASGLCELGSIGAVPIHTSKDLKDYLLFFTLKKEVSAKKAIKKLRKIASKKIGVGPKQIRHIPRSKLKITRTGKLNRRATLHYLLGEEDPSDTFHQYSSASAIPTRDFERHWKNPVHISIARAYAELLGCLSAPKAENNFFDDGGTSFLMAQFLGRVYHITGYQLLLSDFFVQPTLGHVFKLLELAKKNGLSTLQPGQCLERVRTLASDWKGERLSPQSLLFGFNTQGSRPPLFWIFNQANELELLSKALGKDQPLYGMRSLTQIQEIPELNDQSLSEISNAYLLELLAISHKRGFYLGGNCQGSIIAFWMARELSRLNLPPKQLFLMEWSFDWGPLDLSTTFLYGAESTTRHIYTAHKDTSTHYSNLSLGHPWKERFPQHQTRKISGNHGQFFEPENLSSLAKTILSVTNGL